jgi:hypothetical protein
MIVECPRISRPELRVGAMHCALIGMVLLGDSPFPQLPRMSAVRDTNAEGLGNKVGWGAKNDSVLATR